MKGLINHLVVDPTFKEIADLVEMIQATPAVKGCKLNQWKLLIDSLKDEMFPITKEVPLFRSLP